MVDTLCHTAYNNHVKRIEVLRGRVNRNDDNSRPTVILAQAGKSVNRVCGRSGVIPEPTVQSG